METETFVTKPEQRRTMRKGGQIGSTTNSPNGGDSGGAAGLAVKRRGRVAEHGLMQQHPLGGAGVDRVGRRHPRRVRVGPRIVVLPLDLRRVVRDTDGGLGDGGGGGGGRRRLGGHGRRRRPVRGSGWNSGWWVGLEWERLGCQPR
jgi:hypothetical protein